MAESVAEMKGYVEGEEWLTSSHFIHPNSTVAGLAQWVWRGVWREDFWLPAGLRWEDLENSETHQLPQTRDVLLWPLVMALVFLAVQHLWVEPRLLAPLARSAGVANNRPPPPRPCPPLEAVYRRHKTKPPRSVLEEVAQQASMATRQAEHWLRVRHRSSRLTQHDYFLTSGATVVYHFCFCLAGWVIMYNKPWVWDTSLCWREYPYHNLDSDVRWYYILVLAFYYSVLISEAIIPRRVNDGRLKIFVHHICTVALMTFSWVCNFIRIGTLVLLVHEWADVPLLIAKMLIYAHRKSLANVVFAIFLVSWIFTRCIMYPFWVMHSVFFEGTTYMFMPSAYLFMGLLTLLLVLNLLWTVLILRVFLRTIFTRVELKEPTPPTPVPVTKNQPKNRTESAEY